MLHFSLQKDPFPCKGSQNWYWRFPSLKQRDGEFLWTHLDVLDEIQPCPSLFARAAAGDRRLLRSQEARPCDSTLCGRSPSWCCTTAKALLQELNTSCPSRRLATTGTSSPCVVSQIGRSTCIAVPSLRAPSSVHPYPSSSTHIYVAGTRCRRRSIPMEARSQMPCLRMSMSTTTTTTPP